MWRSRSASTSSALRKLMYKYRDTPMSLADACLARHDGDPRGSDADHALLDFDLPSIASMDEYRSGR